MPFDTLGTFNRSQFERLAKYAREQLPLVEGKLLHLTVEQQRLGVLGIAYDLAGRPSAYSANPIDSYLGKLLSAYEILGGDVFHDLQVRPMSDPVFLVKGDEVNPARFMSNGEPLPQPGLADAPSAKLLQQMRSSLNTSFDRRAALERKIRRTLDYGDQLQAEITELGLLKQAAETEGSMEFFISAVSQLIADPTYRAIAEDHGKDPFGKFIRAPLSAYEPGGNRTADDGLTVERTEQGYSVSGEEAG